MALVLHLGGVGECGRLIWEWSVHSLESGDLHCYQNPANEQNEQAKQQKTLENVTEESDKDGEEGKA